MIFLGLQKEEVAPAKGISKEEVEEISHGMYRGDEVLYFAGKTCFVVTDKTEEWDLNVTSREIEIGNKKYRLKKELGGIRLNGKFYRRENLTYNSPICFEEYQGERHLVFLDDHHMLLDGEFSEYILNDELIIDTYGEQEIFVFQENNESIFLDGKEYKFVGRKNWINE